jgi:NAD(P)H-hydrate epimerase
MRAAEAAAFASGISEAELQARAGRAVATLVERLFPTGAVVVLAGIGNNGRDGWVAACDLASDGRKVSLYLAPRHAVADAELDRFRRLGGLAIVHKGSETITALGDWLARATVAVDGLLGIGGRGPLRPPLDELARVLNRATRAGAAKSRAREPAPRVLSIDIPSGVDADTGAVDGEAVRADATLVLGGLKEGLLRFPGAGFAGLVYGDDIGLPEALLADQPVAVLDRATARATVPHRPPDGHKGRFGRVVVAAGSPSYYGAAFLAGGAAARSGCGLVAFAAAPALQGVLAGMLPEATYIALPDRAPEEGAGQAADRVMAALNDAEALLLGPGVGRSPGARELVLAVLEGRAARGSHPPAVVDADALFVLAMEPSVWDRLGRGLVLTPHYGEMARLTGLAITAIADEPWRVALEAAARWGQVVVLKGPFTVVAGPEGGALVLPHANPALGTGGTGDVLAGTIAGLLAQGLTPLDAARVGVYVHGGAAHRVLAGANRDLLLASDLLPAIACELSELRAERGAFAAATWAPWADLL